MRRSTINTSGWCRGHVPRPLDGLVGLQGDLGLRQLALEDLDPPPQAADVIGGLRHLEGGLLATHQHVDGLGSGCDAQPAVRLAEVILHGLLPDPELRGHQTLVPETAIGEERRALLRCEQLRRRWLGPVRERLHETHRTRYPLCGVKRNRTPARTRLDTERPRRARASHRGLRLFGFGRGPDFLLRFRALSVPRCANPPWWKFGGLVDYG